MKITKLLTFILLMFITSIVNPVESRVVSSSGTSTQGRVTSGVTEFIKLIDTPNTYIGSNGYVLVVLDNGVTFKASSSLTGADHGSLGGLSDDDHTQYLNTSRADTWLATKTTDDVDEGVRQYFTAERTDDQVATLLQNGSNVALAYDDVNGTLTISSTDTNTQLTQEQVEDYVGALVTNGSNTTVNYDDVNGVISIASTGGGGGGSGTVTSVAVNNGDTYLTVTGSPITTSGTITLGFNDPGFITGNETITLSGDVSGSGTTSITTTVANDSHNHTSSTITLASTNLTDTTNIARLNATQTFTGVNTFTQGGSSDTVSINHTSGAGIALDISKAGDGEGLRVAKTSGSGNAVTITGGALSTNNSINMSGQTASTIASFDASKNIVSLATTTYPSLTELSYVKGVTSAIQTQLNTKISDISSFTTDDLTEGVTNLYFTNARADARISNAIGSTVQAYSSNLDVLATNNGDNLTIANITQITNRSHTNLSDIGTNTHAQIDTHIADSTIHFTEGSIDHGSIAGLADDDHTQYHNDSRALTWLGTRSTSDLAEGTNLYYTGTRFNADLLTFTPNANGDLITSVNGAVSTLGVGADTTCLRVNGDKLAWEACVTGGGGGTVTSVAANNADQYMTITGSPITTAGTLSFDFADNLVLGNGAVTINNGDDIVAVLNGVLQDTDTVLLSINEANISIAASQISDQNAGTDITADLEEEVHCSEHDSADVDCSGETIIFAADSVDPANLAETDFGDFTVSSDVASLDADTVGESELLESMNFTATGAWNFGGASSLEIKNQNDCSTETVEGEICWDADNNTLYLGNGTSAQAITGGGGGASEINDLSDAATGTTSVLLGTVTGDVGSRNVAVGKPAFSNNTTTGLENTAIGYLALNGNTTGDGNTCVGAYVCNTITTGLRNIAIGRSAMNSTQGNLLGNVVMGYQSMVGADNGADYNTAVGYEALRLLTTGSYNTAVGRDSSRSLTTGSNNISLGYAAGDNVTTGSTNITIGNNIDAVSATGSNQLNIGNTIYGDISTKNIGIGANLITEKLNVEGAIALDEISAPSLTSGYGKLYVKSADSLLYFKDDSGTEYNLTSGGSGNTHVITAVLSGAGSALTAGLQAIVYVPYACTITAATAIADPSGSVTVDIWKDSYANYPPTNADSITASAPVTISSGVKSQDTTLTGWTTSVSAGDFLIFNVDSATTSTFAEIFLTVQKI